MRSVFSVAIELRAKPGCIGVVVGAKPEAENYYTRYGLIGLEVIEGARGERLDLAQVETAAADQYF